MARRSVRAKNPRSPGGVQDSRAVDRSAPGPVGIVSESLAGLVEVICWLARERVGVSQVIAVEDLAPHAQEVSAAMLAGLQRLQTDHATDVIVVIAQALQLDVPEPLLARVRGDDKPTVVCFPGRDLHPVWRAGAIPASRLDEAAMRAAAWVRGWDQALVSSRLEELDDQLARQAHGLRPSIGPGRHRIQGLFASTLLCHEARSMLADVTGQPAEESCMDLTAEPGPCLRYLQDAMRDPEMAVILLDGVLGHGAHADPAAMLAELGTRAGDGPLIIVHACAAEAALEARLQELGVVPVASNAAGARLAGMITSGLAAAVWRPEVSRAVDSASKL